MSSAIDDAREGFQLGTTNRLDAPITRRRRIAKHLGYRLAVKTENPCRLANRHPIDVARAPNATLQIH
jgi:hypothetical protein